ncbi:MAG: sulfotransferase family protein, partial [Bacteroidota bacterium]
MDNINKSCKRICLWSGPRNISTALMYSFAQRPDTKVIDEPLYAHYLSKTDAKDYHPGSEEVLAKMEHDGAKVIQEILGPQKQEVLFVKQMTHHLLDLNLDFLNEVVNVLLTRDPKDMLPSYAKQVKNPKLYDVGYALHIELI